MAQSLATLVRLEAQSAPPVVDMEDLRLDPQAQDVTGDDVLLVWRERDGAPYWIMQNAAGQRREVDRVEAVYTLPYHPAEPVIRVFLSSTFRDFAVEREHLIKTVFPRLKRLAQDVGVTLQEIDLRWGVTTEQVQRGETVAICLEEIDRCRDYPPFFIGMLGERYGWVPEGAVLDALDRHLAGRGAEDVARDIRRRARATAMSVTEMEMRYGVLDQPPARRHALFYNRASDLTAQLSRSGVATPADYYDATCEAMQARLKAELADNGLLRIDGYRSVRELGEDIERMLGAAIVRLGRSCNSVATQYVSPMPDGFDVNEAIDQDIATGRIDLARDSQLDWDDGLRWAYGAANAPRLLILGPSGSGKRTQASREIVSLESISLHCRSGYFNDTEGAAHYLRTALCAKGMPPSSSGGLARVGLRETLEALTWRTAIWITDIDLLSDGRELVELLAQVANPGLCFVVTASDPGYASASEHFAVRTLPALAAPDRATFIASYLTRFRKALDAVSAARIAAMPLAGSPLFLTLVLDELRRGAVFETLSAVIDTYAGMVTLEEAYTHALDTWLHYVDEDGTDRAAWHRALATLCVASRGVPDGFFTDSEGAGLPPLGWASWVGLASPIMVQVAHGWQLRDPLLKTVIAQRAPGAQLEARLALAHYLEASGASNKRAGAIELTAQLSALATASGDTGPLYAWMLAPGTLAHVSGRGDPALLTTCWRQLLEGGHTLDALLADETVALDDCGLLVSLLCNVGAWPALETVTRRLLAAESDAQRSQWEYMLILALWKQDRVAEAQAAIAPPLQAWMAAPDQAPPEAMGALMAMVADGDIQPERWAATLQAGLQALMRPHTDGASLGSMVNLMAAMPFVATLDDARLSQQIAQRCVQASYDIPGAQGLMMRLMAVAEVMTALYRLGQYAEGIETGSRYVDVAVRDGAQTEGHGTCARLLAACLMELGRLAEAQVALAFAWDYEALRASDPAVAVQTSGMMVVCLIRLSAVASSQRWLGIFLDHAAAAPDIAWEVSNWLGATLEGVGRGAERQRLLRDLAARLPPQ